MGIFKKPTPADNEFFNAKQDPNFWDKPLPDADKENDPCTLCGRREFGILYDEHGNPLLCPDCQTDAELFARVVMAKEYIKFKKKLG